MTTSRRKPEPDAAAPPERGTAASGTAAIRPAAVQSGPDAAPRSAVDDAVVAVDDLTIRAGHRTLVDRISLEIGARQRVGIIGASGSGKTLTALAIAGLLPGELCASGSVRVTGFDGNVLTARERELASMRGRSVGMVFQEPMTALNPTMRVGRQVAESLTLHAADRPRTAVRRAVRELLGSAGLGESDRVAAAYPHQLSGGQRQRIMLAIAMANEPEVLICDEPTTALDVRVQATVLELIERRVDESGAALLFISHDLAVVASLCDEIVVMWNGSVVERGTTIDVLTAPQHAHTRQLLADSEVQAP